MKQVCLVTILGGLLVLLPSAVLAQDAEGSEEGTSEETTSEEATAEETTSEEATTEEGETAAEETETAGAEETSEPPPADPEPELSAEGSVEASTETGADLAADLEGAEQEAAQEDEVEEVSEEELEAEKLPWRNSLFIWDNALNTAAFDPGAGLTHNPTYTMAFSLRPRWYVTDSTSIRLRQDLSIELTDSDGRPRNREPVLGDTRIELVNAKILEVEGFTLGAGPRITLPTSTASQAYDKILSLGGALSISRDFEVLEGLSLGLSSTYLYTFAGRDTAGVEGGSTIRQSFAGEAGSTAADPQSSGTARDDQAGTIGLTAELSPVENLSFATSFTWWWRSGVRFEDAMLPEGVVGGSSSDPTIISDDATKGDLLTWFTLGAAYTFTDWITAELTYSHLTTELSPDGSRRNPFWSIDSEISLSATITLDALYQDFAGDEDLEDPAAATASRRNGRRAQQ